MLRFPLIVGVVLIHNYSTVSHLDGTARGSSLWLQIAHFGISEGIARVAVPLFYTMSGFLFFTGFETLHDYRRKLKSRVGTLAVPFLLWNAAALAVYGLGELIPTTAHMFSGSSRFVVSYFHLFDYANAMLGITGPPIAYQFWFIRDLMALVVITPVIRSIFKRKAGPALLALLFVTWLADVWPIAWPKPESVLFFCAGAYLCYAGANLESADKTCKRLTPLFAVTLICNILWFSLYLQRVMVLIGLLCSWWLVSLFAGRESGRR